MQRELDPIANPRMIPIPKNFEPARRGIFQVNLTENLKRLSGDLAGIRRKPVCNFEAVLIGLILVIARVGVADRRRDDRQ